MRSAMIRLTHCYEKPLNMAVIKLDTFLLKEKIGVKFIL